MRTGHLYIETSSEHPGLVRVLLADRKPAMPDREDGSDVRIRYVARFSDVDAARMHVHELLRRHLLDVDAGLYRVSTEEAVAAAESLDLSRERLFLDSTLGQAVLLRIESRIDALGQKRRWRNRLWYFAGYFVLALGLAHALIGLLA